MIFVTVGTHQQPFERLVAAAVSLADEPGTEVVLQFGYAERPPSLPASVPFLSYAEVQDHMARARVVVTHAGVGSIITAIRAGHVPIVVPRLHRLGEHVDDHQVELVTRLEAEGLVRVVTDTADLRAAVGATPARRTAPAAVSPDAERLREAVRAEISRARIRVPGERRRSRRR